jgi:hypothetical protein
MEGFRWTVKVGAPLHSFYCLRAQANHSTAGTIKSGVISTMDSCLRRTSADKHRPAVGV